MNTSARPTTNIDADALARLRDLVATPLMEPDADTLRLLTDQVSAWTIQHTLSLPEQPIGLTDTPAAMQALLSEPPPEVGQAFAEVLAEFDRKVAPYAFRTNHPRFLAFVPAAPAFESMLADWLCAATNFFCGVWLEAAGPAQVELVVLDWFKNWLGYPVDARGLLTSGGSEANLTALVTARERLAFADRARAIIYVSEQRHWSIDRAARIAGLQPTQIRTLPTTATFCLPVSALEAAIQQDRAADLLPWLVVANAGSTNTGSVDALADLATVCEHEHLWLHVDAAYGWPMLLLEQGRQLLAGIERADSVTLNPHKWFAQTYEAGCLLVRDGRLLTEAFQIRPEYMQDVTPGDSEINFADHGLALTRRFRALKIWLSVKVLGVDWFRRLARHGCALAQYAEALMRRSGRFEILSPASLSIVAFRFRPDGIEDSRLDQVNLDALETLRQSGRAFLSSTRLNGRVAIRMCFVNGRTTARDVEEVVYLLEEAGDAAVLK